MQKSPDVYKPKFLHYLIVVPIFIFVRMLIATIRFKCSADIFRACASPMRLLGVSWHRNIIFLAKSKVFFRPKIDMAGLVSASKDAAYLVAFFNLMGIKSVRGSRARRGREAVFDLAEKLHSGCDVFVTPDGPRGPACVAKRGFLTIAEISGVRVMLLRFKPRRYFTIPSWDKFIVPAPFSSIDVDVAEFESAASLQEAAAAAGKTPEQFVSDYLNWK